MSRQEDDWSTITAGAHEAQPAGRLSAGQIFGPYGIVRLLDHGGIGEVYEAEHLEHGRRIALKILKHPLTGPQDSGRFLREGRLAASITHPNSVYVYGTEVIDGFPAIAMEIVSGGCLKDRVDQSGPMPPEQAVDATLQAIAGLEAAQAAGVLHRDVKPSNLFVGTGGKVKVGDYGLSVSNLSNVSMETQLTATGMIIGTPAFAPPEQLRGDELDVRADIYSAGASLFYLDAESPL